MHPRKSDEVNAGGIGANVPESTAGNLSHKLKTLIAGGTKMGARTDAAILTQKLDPFWGARSSRSLPLNDSM